MKRLLLFLFIAFSFCIPSFAQTQVNLFYNKEWEITDKSKAVYFRNCIISTVEFWHFIGPVRDFYAEDGKLYMTGNYNGAGEKQGEFIFYFKNGKVSSKGSFDKNKRVGLWEYWFDNGQKKQEFIYEGEQLLIKNSWSKNGKTQVTNGNGKYDGIYIGPNDGSSQLTGSVQNYKKEGIWDCNILWDNGVFMRKSYQETFTNGRFLQGKLYLTDNNFTDYSVEEEEKDVNSFSVRTTEKFAYDALYFGEHNNEALINFIFNKIKPTYSAKDYPGKTNEDKIKLILQKHAEKPFATYDVRLPIKVTIAADGTLSNIIVQENRYPNYQKYLELTLGQIKDLTPEIKNGKPVTELKFQHIVKFEMDPMIRDLYH